MASWDTATVKAQLRLTAQRLGQLQDKLESQAQLTRRDIATLLQQGNVPLARAKARKLIGDDSYGDLLQTLEMQVGVVLGHVNEFEQTDTLSPPVVEAAASIVYAAPRTNSRDLRVVRDLLVQRLGPDFAKSITGNKDRYVSQRILRATSPPPPNAAKLDHYLYNVAKNHDVQWLPDFSPEQKVNALSQMLEPATMSVIDMEQLRKLCSHGLPEHPPWLRPKVWRLLLGTFPPEKAKWVEEARKSRDSYYDLVRRLLEPFSDLPSPASPLAPLDASLMDVSNKLSQVPSSLLGGLEEDPEVSALCPLDNAASDDIKIKCAGNLAARLRVLREAQAAEAALNDMTPEIRLEATPEIRLENGEENGEDDDSDDEGQTVEVPASRSGQPLSASGLPTPGSLSIPGTPASGDSGRSAASKTLLASRAYSDMGTNQKHSSALLRLLYLHSCLNPANRFPHVASLLVPIYSALSEEVDLQDSPHVEADTFWVFEAMVGEFTDLEDEENASIWTRKLSERLWWADAELAENLQTKGLDPALPHYSYRWLVTLLTHTLPLLGVVMAWDALFSRPMSTRDSNPKLDYLMDICTSMLLCARSELLRLGKRGQADLWSDALSGVPFQALGERELELAFVDGMTFLQTYPLDKVGGIETVLQAAFDLTVRRDVEANAAKAVNNSLGRLRESVWKGLGYQTSTLETHPEESDTVTESDYDTHDEDETAATSTVATTASALTSRFATTVWRGISNQSAMEPSPSPEPPSTPVFSPSPSLSPVPDAPPKESVPATSTLPNISRSLFGYAGKLRESDAAANLAKVTTNWRVKALDAWTKRASTSQLSTPPTPPPKSKSGSASVDLSTPRRGSQWEGRRGSMPADDRYTEYVPPERPSYFRPPRDSIIIPSGQMLSPTSPIPGESSPLSDGGSVGSASGKRSGPRPLLLSSSSLITTTHPRSPIPGGHSRSPTNGSMSSAADHQWADMVRNKRRTPSHKDSLSSLSSLSPADAFARPQRTGTNSDRDSMGFGSRIVPLRSSPSPIAPNSRRTTMSSRTSSPITQHRRTSTTTTSPAGSDSGRGSQKGDSSGSPGTVPSPPPPKTPHVSAAAQDVQVKATEAQRGSVVLDDSNVDSPVSPVMQVKLSRRAPFPRSRAEYEDGQQSDSSAPEQPSRTPRAKSKRYPPRLAGLRSRATADAATDEFGQKTLAPEPQDDMENATTPRATTFDEAGGRTSVSPRRVRKISGEGEARTRKISNEGRTRKLSGEGSGRTRKISSSSDGRRQRNSAAVDGDDEGYNDLLSAYESEDV